MDLNLDCGVCGLHAMVEGIEDIVVIHGFLETWRDQHHHSELELKMYQDAEIAVRQHQAETYRGDD